MSEDGSVLLVSDRGLGATLVFDLAGAYLGTMDGLASPKQLAFHRDLLYRWGPSTVLKCLICSVSPVRTMRSWRWRSASSMSTPTHGKWKYKVMCPVKVIRKYIHTHRFMVYQLKEVDNDFLNDNPN